MTLQNSIPKWMPPFGVLAFVFTSGCRTAPPPPLPITPTEPPIQASTVSSTVSSPATPTATSATTPATTPTAMPRPAVRVFIENLSNLLSFSDEEIEKQFQNSTNADEKIINGIALANRHLRNREFSTSISILNNLDDSESDFLQNISALLLGDAYIHLKQYEEAAEALEEFATDPKAPFYKRSAALYFQALVSDNNTNSNNNRAQEFLQKHKTAVLSASNNYTLLNETFARDKSIFSEREQIELSRRLMRDFGSHPQLRQLGLQLANIDENNVVPTTPIDSLNLTEKEKLLQSADLLLSAWEYPLAIRILEKLRSAKVFGAKFSKASVLLLYGRALNASERYDEAATVYNQAIAAASTSTQQEEAKRRLLLSFHFNQDFEREIKAIQQNIRKNKKTKGEVLWQLFWAQYLDERYDEAWKTGNKIQQRLGKKTAHSTMAHAVLYWKARMQENQDDITDARKNYTAIISQHAESYFAILARWRLALMSNSNNQVRKNVSLKEFSSPINIPLSDSQTSEFEKIQKFNKFGLTQFAIPLFSNIEYSANSKTNAIASAQKAIALRNPYRAITLVEDFGTDRFAKGLSPTQMSQWMKTEPLFWNAWFPTPYFAMFKSAAQKYDVPESLALSVARKESIFDASATSVVGAMGLMQIMPRTGYRIAKILEDNEFQPSDLKRAEINIVYGTWYLQRLTNYYRGNELLAITAYNAGPAAVDRWIRQNPEMELDEFLQNIPYDQTRDYVPKVMRYMDTYLKFYAGSDYVLPQSTKLPEPNKSLSIF